MSTCIGVDVGGTFTDLVMFDEASGSVALAKRPTTADAPERAVIESVSEAGGGDLAGADYFLHGTTVGLNALLQRSGARVGLLATAGFRDVLEIRRGSREEMLNLWWRPPTPLVPRHLRLPIRERMLADGTVLTGLEAEDVAAAVARLRCAQGSTRSRSRSSTATATPSNELLGRRGACASTGSRARSRSRTASRASTGSSSAPRRP